MSVKNKGFGYRDSRFFVNSGQNIGPDIVQTTISQADDEGSVPDDWILRQLGAELATAVAIRKEIQRVLGVGKSQANRIKKILVERG